MDWIFQFISTFSIFSLLFIDPTTLFDTIHKSHCTFWCYSWVSLYYLAYFFNIFSTISAKSFQFQLNKLFQTDTCLFGSAFRRQKAFFETKKINQAFGNVSKCAFLKMLCFEMQRIHPKRADRFLELLQMQKRFWSILPLDMQGMIQITLISLTTKYTENWQDKHRK